MGADRDLFVSRPPKSSLALLAEIRAALVAPVGVLSGIDSQPERPFAGANHTLAIDNRRWTT
jgi:hypothetical protein